MLLVIYQPAPPVQPAPPAPSAVYPSIETTPIVIFPQQPTPVQAGSGNHTLIFIVHSSFVSVDRRCQRSSMSGWTILSRGWFERSSTNESYSRSTRLVVRITTLPLLTIPLVRRHIFLLATNVTVNVLWKCVVHQV